MKILSITALIAAGLLGFASCNKQYNVEVSDSQTPTNNNGGSSSGNNNFNWSGTAPLSAKVDGVSFLATTIDIQDFAGYYYIIAADDAGTSINPSIPKNAIAGQIYSMPSPANLSWQSDIASGQITLGAKPGKVKIVTNSATVLEGYFWADAKDITGLKDTLVHITEGYFKIDK